MNTSDGFQATNPHYTSSVPCTKGDNEAELFDIPTIMEKTLDGSTPTAGKSTSTKTEALASPLVPQKPPRHPRGVGAELEKSLSKQMGVS